jgi:DNA polymerase III gamma/tau subunit
MNTENIQEAPNISPHHLPPAQLWLGKHEELEPACTTWLQKVFCAHGGCGQCAACQGIRQQQFHAITWLYPDKQYTLEHLSVISNTIAFALEPGHHHFFVIHKAECLTQACSNSLLKSLEEPPAGYHFILLAAQADDVLPTIRSRCQIQNYASQAQYIRHQALFDIFTGKSTPQPSVFLKTLEQAAVSEQETLELLDQLLVHWGKAYMQALKDGQLHDYTKADVRSALIKQALEKPPMPGSSNLVWKNLFLQMQRGR